MRRIRACTGGVYHACGYPFVSRIPEWFRPDGREIRVRGVLARTETYPPKWLLRLEKPIDVGGKQMHVIEIMEPSPGPAAPLTNGSRYEFTGRLDIQRNRALLRVTTIRRLEDPTSTNKLPQSKSAKP